MIFKKLKLDLFGELLQCLYDCEINIKIEWVWDGGIEWSFGDELNGFKDWSPFTQKTYQSLSRNKNIDSDLEYQGGFIIMEYLQNYIPFTSLAMDKSETKPKYKENSLTLFLWENDFLKKIHFPKGYINCDQNIDGDWVFSVFETKENQTDSYEGDFSTYLDAMKKIDSFI